MSFRIGFGIDFHQLVPGRDLWIGGVKLPHIKILLQKTFMLIAEAGYKVENIDSTVCLEQPKIKQYIPEMQKVIASILSLNENAVSIKATTSEKMGFVGREEGIAAYATALLISFNN